MLSSKFKNAGMLLLLIVVVVLYLSFSIDSPLSVVRSLNSHPADPELIKKWNISSLNNELHLITMLSLYCGNRWEGYESFTDEQLDERDREYLDVLESNINHPLVKQVHLLFTDSKALEVVRKQKWPNSYKIIPVKMQRRIHMMDFFYYASKNLINKIAVGLNGDIAIGEGFDLIDPVKMRDERILLTLTRHGWSKDDCTVPNMCLDKKYMGSHDTHVFVLNEPLPIDQLLKLDYPINSWQAENGMIGAFQFLLNFHVLNPCKVLKTYHHHCSSVHKNGKTKSIKDPPYNWPLDLIGRAVPGSNLS